MVGDAAARRWILIDSKEISMASHSPLLERYTVDSAEWIWHQLPKKAAARPTTMARSL